MIRVLLFARLADLAKTRETEFECGEEGVCLNELTKQVVARFPALEASLAQPRLLFLAINQEQALLDDQVKDGDEVAIMPPFSGG
jgi:molybdopterin converting factor small subunit